MKVLHIGIAGQERDFSIARWPGGHFCFNKITFVTLALRGSGGRIYSNRCNNVSERFVFSIEQEAQFTKFLGGLL